MNKYFITILALICASVFANCATAETVSTDTYKKEIYTNYKESPYVLPFLPKQKHKVIQGNCEKKEKPWTHYDNLKYAYDFEMPIGTEIIAAKTGTVLFVRDEFTDNDHGKNQGNAIVIIHEDGTFALYAHITHKGSKVRLGQIVKQGDIIALSGNSGESPIPHLHFQVNSTGDFAKGESVPITFKNVFPEAGRLEKNAEYEAN